MTKAILTPEQAEKRKAYNAAWHLANKEKVAARVKKQRSANPEKYLAITAKWRINNSDKVTEYAALYYKENKEAILSRLKKLRPANASVLAARFLAWRLANRDKVNSDHVAWCAKNPEKRNAWRNAWSKANPENKRISHQNRRSKKKASGGRLSQGLTDRLLILQKGKCACCGVELAGRFHLDHIMPIALGGLNVDSNIQLLTPACNMRKSAKHPVDFMQDRGFLL